MTKLEQLIEELCPDGVEYIPLQNVVSIERGKRVVKQQLSQENGYPVYQNSLTPLGFYSEYNYSAETTFIIVAGAAGEIGYSKVDFWAADDCFAIVCPKTVLNRYIYHVLMNHQQNIKGHVRKASIPRLPRTAIDSLRIPVPPLPVQGEIVKILDNFTELTVELSAELSEELSARKKQYEYYKSQLFNFDSIRVEMKPLGDEFSFIRNGFVGTATPYYTSKDKGVRYLKGTNIHNGVISDNEEEYITLEFHQKHIKNQLKLDDILVVQSGHVGECAVVGKKYAGANCHALIIMSNDGNCNSKYVVYYLQTVEGKQKLARITTGGTIKHILASGMKKLVIPFPSLEEQNKIVEILDRFDALCNDISEGLHAEIEARQKQYEHYRDKLLTFKEVTSV